MFQDLALAGPILLPALAALLLIGIDLLPRSDEFDCSFLLAFVGSIISLAYTGLALVELKTGYAFYSTLDVSQGALGAIFLIHAAAFLAILLSRLYLRSRPEVERPEYYAFILISASGMALLASANDLVNVFLGIELLSIPLYLLTATHRSRVRSIEAGIKYLLLGAFASSFLLFGMGLLYGSSGTTLLSAMDLEIVRLGTGGGLAALGCAMFLVGLLFKIAAVPFHMWTPDVYEGAPTPVTAFMATATKAAMFAALIKCAPTLAAGLGPEIGASTLGVIAVLTMFVGNLAALRQTNLKRLLAWSSVAHGGYMLVGVAALVRQGGSGSGGSAILYYLAAYTAMNIGAFGIAILLDRGEGREGTIELKGLGRDRPILGVIMTVFVLALAGIPPTAGFLGKLYLFKAAVEAELYVVAVAGVLASVIGLYYYLRLLLFIWVNTSEETAGAPDRSDFSIAMASTVTLAVVVVLGVLPGRIVEYVASL